MARGPLSVLLSSATPPTEGPERDEPTPRLRAMPSMRGVDEVAQGMSDRARFENDYLELGWQAAEAWWLEPSYFGNLPSHIADLLGQTP